MPTYEYEHVDKKGAACEDPFEAVQSIKEDAFTVCPTCGKPVKKLISRASFIMPMNMSTESTAAKGFTTYRKSGAGTYEKAGGEGPDIISAGDD
jgi:putative FmdB family regulatory protein